MFLQRSTIQISTPGLTSLFHLRLALSLWTCLLITGSDLKLDQKINCTTSSLTCFIAVPYDLGSWLDLTVFSRSVLLALLRYLWDWAVAVEALVGLESLLAWLTLSKGAAMFLLLCNSSGLKECNTQRVGSVSIRQNQNKGRKK